MTATSESAMTTQPDTMIESAHEALATATWADEVVCVEGLEWFMAVGLHYLDFRQTTDAEVAEILESAQHGAE